MKVTTYKTGEDSYEAAVADGWELVYKDNNSTSLPSHWARNGKTAPAMKGNTWITPTGKKLAMFQF